MHDISAVIPISVDNINICLKVMSKTGPMWIPNDFALSKKVVLSVHSIKEYINVFLYVKFILKYILLPGN